LLDFKTERSQRNFRRDLKRGEHALKDCRAGIEQARNRRHRPDAIKMPFFQLETSRKKALCELLDLSFSWSNEQPLFEHVSLSIDRGERLALEGPNGSGKSTLLDLMCQKMLPLAGEVRMATENVMYLDQQHSLLDFEKSVFENLPLSFQTEKNRSVARYHLSCFFIGEEKLNLPVKKLSGGERLKLCLALGFIDGNLPELLILDEPTNHVDLESLEVVEEFLASYPGALLVVSHDEQFKRNLGCGRLDVRDFRPRRIESSL